MSLYNATAIVRPDFNTDGGRRSAELRDYIYPTFMQRRGTWYVKDVIAAESLAMLARLANALEGKSVARPRAAMKAPVTVRQTAVADEWTTGARREVRTSA